MKKETPVLPTKYTRVFPNGNKLYLLQEYFNLFLKENQIFWRCTTMAKELGIFSESGRPHDKAMSAVI